MFSKFQELFGGHVDKRKAKEAEERTMNNPYLLSESERKQAYEAKERTLRILSDALKKKESLLVEDPRDIHDKKMMYADYCPFITTDLVKKLIQELKKVTFAKNTDPKLDIEANAYVYPGSEDRTIYLCAPFWKRDPESRARENTIIHEVSHFLEYGHTVQENSDRVQKSPQSMLCPQTARTLESLLTSFMDHSGTYTNGSYSCCGETSRDTVCVKSMMGDDVRSMRKKDHFWRQILLEMRNIAGDETANSYEGADTSDEDMDASNEDVDTARKQTDTAIQKVKRRIALLKRKADMLKKQTNLLKTENNPVKKKSNLLKAQTNLLKAQTNLLKVPTNLLKAQTNLLKAHTDLLKKPTKKQDYVVETPADTMKTETNMEETQTTLLKIETTLLMMQITLFKMEDVVAEIKVDVLETLADMEETLANVLEQV